MHKVCDTYKQTLPELMHQTFDTYKQTLHNFDLDYLTRHHQAQNVKSTKN